MDKETLAEILGVEEVSDEQFEKFQKAHESELDKARNQASRTSAKNTEKKAREEFEKTLEEKANEKAKAMLEALTQSEEEKLEAQRKQLEEEKIALNVERKRSAVESRLKAAGYAEESLEKFTDMFSVYDDVDSCVSTVDTFLGTVKETVETQVNAAKSELLSAGSPAGSNKGGSAGSGVVNVDKKISEIYEPLTKDGAINDRQANLNADIQAVKAAFDGAVTQSLDD